MSGSPAALLWAGDTDVHGSPEEVRGLGAALESYAEMLGTARRIASATLDALRDWRGEAADACGDRLRGLVMTLTRNEEAARGASRALSSYALRLADAHAEAGHARALWAEADELTGIWGARQVYANGGLDPTLTHAAEDPGWERRVWARGVLARAFEQRDTAARSTVAEIVAAEAVLRRNAGWRLPSELAKHVGRDTRQGITSGLVELASLAGWFAGVPFDPKGSAGELWSSGVWALANPVDALREATNWDDLTGGHPIRAVTDLVPGAVATYLTGGAARGVAVRRRTGTEPYGGFDGDPALWLLQRRATGGPVDWLGGEESFRAEARRIGFGHAWPDHAEHWRRLGIRSPDDLTARVEEAMRHPTFWARQANGRAIFWDESDELCVMYNPDPAHDGSVYKPQNGFAYIRRKLSENYQDPRSDDFDPDRPKGTPW